MFQGFPIGSSLSKSAANDQAGAHCQMSGIVAALVTAIVALFFTQFFYPLPEATLGAIVIVAVSHMVKVDKMKHLYHVRRADFILALVTMLAVLTFETLQALLLAVIISLFALVWHASQPRLAVLGRVPNSLDFGDVRRHPKNQILSGLLMVRPENGLFFANAVGFREAIIREMGSGPEPAKVVLADLGATTDLDVPSADMLIELHKELHSRNVRLMLARMITPVREMLERADAMEEIGPEDIFSDSAEAVLEYLVSQYDDSTVRELVRNGLLTVRSLVQARLATAPAERQAALVALAQRLDQEIKRIETDG
jgi:MFS superfamily sulfate permease-like transporter